MPAPTYERSRFNHVCTTSTSSTGLQPVDKDKKLKFVARITGKHNCRWSANYLPPLRYAHLGLGRELKLDAGLLEITYYNGAKVVLEGPVEFTVEKANACRLDLGKLAANVPKPAAGFTVETPTATIVDLGTEFGVEVDKDGGDQVHVFRGEVEVGVLLADGTKKKLRLKRNMAARIDPTDGVVTTIPIRRTGFPQLARASYTRGATYIASAGDARNFNVSDSKSLHAGYCEAWGGDIFRSIFEFDLSRIKTDAGGSPVTINSASLVLFNRGGTNVNDTGVGDSITIELREFAEDFDEATVTWNSLYPAGGNTDGLLLSSETFDPTPDADGHSITFGSSSNFVTAVEHALSVYDNTLRIIATGPESGDDCVARFYYDEADAPIDKRPELIIDYTVISETTTDKQK